MKTMKLLPIATLVIAGAALAACGTTDENRYNETAYADHNGPAKKTYEHEVVYRTPAYDDQVVYVRPAYRVVPVTRAPVYYDGYYYYSY